MLLGLPDKRNAVGRLDLDDGRESLVTSSGALMINEMIRVTGLRPAQYSIGFPAKGPVRAAIETIPEQAWVPALDGDGAPREGAQVAGLTAWMPTPVKPTRSPAKYGAQEWPRGMRVTARRERPHPGRNCA